MSIQSVLNYFFGICQLPRSSGQEDAVRAYLTDFACINKLVYSVDDVGNVCIRRPASVGFEDVPTIVLQSHMDMVCEKEKNCSFSFEKDPIHYMLDGDWIRANKTTLGADNGIGMALSLAVLSSDIHCGPIECLFTVDEEQGFTGVHNMKPGFFSGRYFINLDWENEGEICIGCAGGIKTESLFRFKPSNALKETRFYKLDINGLKGGHSGGHIHLKRANSVKILAEFMSELTEFYLCDMNAGNLPNAIPRYGCAIFGVPKTKDNVVTLFDEFSYNIKMSFIETEKDMLLSLNDVTDIFTKEIQNRAQKQPLNGEKRPENRIFVLSPNDSESVVKSLINCPSGVLFMQENDPNSVETSNNLASVKTILKTDAFNDKNSEMEVKIVNFLRSSSNSKKIKLTNNIENGFRESGASCKSYGNFDAWEPDFENCFLKHAFYIYEKTYKQQKDLYFPKIVVTHAGLECGSFKVLNPEINAISVGPTVLGAHTPSERLNIPSLKRFWNFLVALIVSVKHLENKD